MDNPHSKTPGHKVDYLALNAMLNLYSADGTIQFDRDREAAKEYFLQDVNKRFRFFHDLAEKLDYLIEHGYYEREFIEQYDFAFVKRLYQRLYAVKFRFATFVGAYKFYTGYALKSFDGEEYLERYEDRIAACALYLAAGDERQAIRLADEMIAQRYQPATPTFLNAGKKQRGELVSCFPEGSLVETIGGQIPIEQILEGDQVVTHDGSLRSVLGTMQRTDEAGLVTIDVVGQPDSLVCTPEHPLLVHRWRNPETIAPVLNGDGDSENIHWIRASDVQKGDYVVAGFAHISRTRTPLTVQSYLTTPTIVSGEDLFVELKDAKWSRQHDRILSVQTRPIPAEIALDADFGRWIGYYLAEGHLNPRSTVFTFGTSETEWIEDVQQLSERIFGVPMLTRDNKDGSTHVCCNSKLVTEFMRNLVGSGFDKKILPQELFHAPVSFHEQMLIGALRGDGCTFETAMIMDMVNLPLLHQLRAILLNLGIPVYERHYDNQAGNRTASLRIPSDTKRAHDFITRVGKNLHRFRSSYKAGKPSRFVKEIDGHIMFRVNKATHETGTNTVYNLEVEDNHTYVVHGIVVHNCFLVNVPDQMHGIGRAITSALELSKRGGGVAFNLTNLRAALDPIKGVQGASSGILPVMKLLENCFNYANQLGARQGAGAVYLNAFHLDCPLFLDCKKEAADESIRIKTLSLGIVIPDVVFELAANDEEMYLFSPYDVARKYDKPFADVYISQVYRELVDDPMVRKERFDGGARGFLQRLAEVQFESGYPYVMFEDNVNRQNPIKGKVRMSNLCVTGETELLTGEGVFTAKELHERGGDLTVIVDDRTRNYDLDDETVSSADAIPMHLTSQQAEIFKLTTVEGFELRATKWHRMYVRRGDKIFKIPLAEVTPSDRVLVQPAEGAYGATHEPELAYVAGWLAADGTFGQQRNGDPVFKLSLYGEKQEFSSEIETAIASAIATHYTGVFHHSTTATPLFGEENNGRRTIASAPLTKVLASFGVTPATKLSVPEFVRRGDKDTVMAYLSGVYQGDGCVTGTIQAKTCSIEIGSTHRPFLQQLQRLLINLGSYSRIYAGCEAGTTMLPDGKGGLSEYPVQAMYSLRITDRASREAFMGQVRLRAASQERFTELSSGMFAVIRRPHHHFTARVKEIAPDGVEAVYDTTVAETNSLIFNGIVTGNCSEILQVSEDSEINELQQYETLGKDISCNLGSLNISQVMDGPSIQHTVEVAIRALTQVSDTSNIQVVPSIHAGNQRSHAVGLGQMNLHGFLAREGIDYASREAVDFTDAYFRTIRFHAIWASSRLAKERGGSFDGFADSQYATGEAFEQYLEEYRPRTAKVRRIFERYEHPLPTAEQWRRLAAHVRRHGMYNQNLLAVAPTGSISYVNHATSSIHPITAKIEMRSEGKMGRVYYPAAHMTDDNQHLFRDAYDIGYEALIDVYAAATRHVDQGLSMTLFFTADMTTRDLNRAQLYAWRKGIKTMYYVRVRSDVIAGTETEGCVSCAV